MFPWSCDRKKGFGGGFEFHGRPFDKKGLLCRSDFGSFVKGVPSCFCGELAVVLTQLDARILFSWNAGLFQRAELLLKHAKHTGLNNLYLEAV